MRTKVSAVAKFNSGEEIKASKGTRKFREDQTATTLSAEQSGARILERQSNERERSSWKANKKDRFR